MLLVTAFLCVSFFFSYSLTTNALAKTKPKNKTIKFVSTPTSLPTSPSVTDYLSYPSANTPAMPVSLGVTTNKLVFRTTKLDQRARKNEKTRIALGKQRDDSITKSSEAQRRITALEQLLTEAEEDHDRIASAIQARFLEQYKEGSNAELSFLLSGGVGDFLSRSKTLKDVSKRDARTIQDFEYSIERIEQLQQALTEIRDIEGERTERLGERMDRLGQSVIDARAAHNGENGLVAGIKARRVKAKQEKITNAKFAKAAHDEVTDDDIGNPGTWYVMDGAFQSQIFLPSIASGSFAYDGGTRTPARPATAQQIMRTLTDPLIELDASGQNDIRTGQIDGRILDAMWMAAHSFGYIRVTSLKGDHGVYTTSGNVSEHSIGCAMDIGTIGKTYIQPSAQTPGGEVERAVRFFSGLSGDLAPHQVISLFSLGGPTFAMGDHGDHIHVGYSC